MCSSRNIPFYTPSTEGIGISWGWTFYKNKTFKEINET